MFTSTGIELAGTTAGTLSFNSHGTLTAALAVEFQSEPERRRQHHTDEPGRRHHRSRGDERDQVGPDRRLSANARHRAAAGAGPARSDRGIGIERALGHHDQRHCREFRCSVRLGHRYRRDGARQYRDGELHDAERHGAQADDRRRERPDLAAAPEPRPQQSGHRRRFFCRHGERCDDAQCAVRQSAAILQPIGHHLAGAESRAPVRRSTPSLRSRRKPVLRAARARCRSLPTVRRPTRVRSTAANRR